MRVSARERSRGIAMLLTRRMATATSTAVGRCGSVTNPWRCVGSHAGPRRWQQHRVIHSSSSSSSSASMLTLALEAEREQEELMRRVMRTRGGFLSSRCKSKREIPRAEAGVRPEPFTRVDAPPSVSAASFSAYLRGSSSPFTSGEASPAPAPEGDTQRSFGKRDVDVDVEQQQQQISRHSFLDEWDFRPKKAAEAFHSGDESAAGQRRRAAPVTGESSSSSPPPSVVVHRRREGGRTHGNDKDGDGDGALLSSLRRETRQRLKRASITKYQQSFLYQYAIVEQVALRLTALYHRLGPSAETAPGAASSATADLTVERLSADAEREALRDKALLSIDAQLFEMMGQLQRSLQRLSVHHYTAAAAPSSSSVDGRCLLLCFLQRLSTITSLLRRLPRRSHGFLSPSQAAHYVRLSGVGRAAEQAIRALLTSPASTLLVPRLRQEGGEGTRCEAWSREKAQTQRVFDLLHAVLSLPYEHSPEIGCVTHEWGGDGDAGSGPSSSPPGGVQSMKAEEWCLRSLLRALYTDNSSGGGSAAEGPGKRLLALRQCIQVLRGCMITQGEEVHVLPLAANRRRATVTVFSHPTTASVSAVGVLNAAEGAGSALRIPYGLGKEFLLQTICGVMMVFDEREREGRGAAVHGDSEGGLYKGLGQLLSPRCVASLCSAILFFRVESQEALRLLAAAAPLCAEASDHFSGKEVVSLLLCYATLRFHGHYTPLTDVTTPRVHAGDAGAALPTKNLYIVLGTRAGELGDSLATEDVAILLRALDLVSDKLDSTTLRAALESSLRMRSLHRRPQYDSL